MAGFLIAAIPVGGGFIVVLFAFANVNKLTDYDGRQDELAKEIRDDLYSKYD